MTEDDFYIFLDKVERWINDSGFIENKIDLNKVRNILNTSEEELEDMNYEDIFNMARYLYLYLDGLQTKYNTEQVLINYCDSSILEMLTPVLDNYGDKYVKHEKKLTLAIAENPLAKILNDLKSVSSSRCLSMDKRIDYVKKIADIYFEVAKRRKVNE